jgi:hypothetical protein
VTIALTCACGRRLQIPDQYAGQKGQCPNCGLLLAIPQAGQEMPPPPPAAVGAVPLPSAGPAPELAPEVDGHGRSSPDGWQPPDGLCNHAGQAMSGPKEFFAPPPAEIGEVLSAHSTLKQGVRPRAPGVRLAWALFGAGLGVVLGLGIAGTGVGPFWQLVCPVGFGALGLALALWATRFRHRCSYVGREGAARFTCAGDPQHLTQAELFCFADAAELRTAQTNHYHNGIYTGTNYTFTWTNVAGRRCFQLAGNHRSKDGNPPGADPFHFARAAEMAWTGYLVNQAQVQLQMSGSIYFGLKGGNSLRLSAEALSFTFGGRTTTWDVADLAQARIDQGVVKIMRRDAREGWFSSTGVCRFNYTDLANAQFFLFLLNRLAGVPIN